MHLRHIFLYVLLWEIFICLKDATICRLYFLVIHRFVHSFTFIVTWMIKQSVLLATFRGGFLNRGYLWCKWSRLLSLKIPDANITAVFAHMNISHVSFLHDFKVFISCLCSCFELLVHFMFYWVWTKSSNLKEIFVYLTIMPFIVYFPLLPATLHPKCAWTIQIRTCSEPKPAHLENAHICLFLLCLVGFFFALLFLPYIFFYLNLTGTINVANAQ